MSADMAPDWRSELAHDEDDFSSLFATYGTVMFKAQTIERAIAITLVHFELLGESDMSDDAIGQRLDEVFRQPWGELLGQLDASETADVPKDVRESLTNAKNIRNMLAHRFFADGFLGLLDRHVRPELVDRLAQADEAFEGLLPRLMPLLYEMAEELRGVTAEEIERFKEVVGHAQIPRDRGNLASLSSTSGQMGRSACRPERPRKPVALPLAPVLQEEPGSLGV